MQFAAVKVIHMKGVRGHLFQQPNCPQLLQAVAMPTCHCMHCYGLHGRSRVHASLACLYNFNAGYNPGKPVGMESANLQVLLRGQEVRMQLHNGGLLLTAPPVSLNQLLPHITHLCRTDTVSSGLLHLESISPSIC